tara:strand:+ start:8820 stop:10244 length:1425 start_codon:yes stop_codon:yes gene_type:complete
MSNITNLLDTSKSHLKIFKAAGNVADILNFKAYIVGGYIRDLLLNKSIDDITDIDITVDGNYLEYAKALAKALNLKNVIPFEQFRTAKIMDDEIQIEIAQTRKESYYSQSRKPIVEKASLEEDLYRRDFTINAIAASLNSNNFGSLIDPLKGIKDLNKGLIITPLDPDETFSDDPLRMLRAIRFAAQLDFQIAPNILDSIHNIKKRIEIISWERITEEIIKSLKTEKPSIAFYHFKETGLLKYIFPELNVMSGVEVINGMSHKDVFIHTLQVVDNAAKLSPKMEIRFAALVHDIAKPPTKKFDTIKGWSYHGHEELGRRMLKTVASRMKISNQLKEYLMNLTKLHLRPIALAKKNITDSAIRRLIFDAGDNIDDLMILCRADITTKNQFKIKKYLSNFERVEEAMQNVKLRDELKNFQPPINGKEIMEKFNLKAGKEVGLIKNSIKDAILDGKIKNNYDDAYKFMLSIKDNFIK